MQSGARGFSLVELMVALAVGMIVIGAVLALVLSIIRANNQTIQATRLTQELRATATVISSDLKRSGGVDDPLTVATALTGNEFKAIDASTGSCIRYGYARPRAGGGFDPIFRAARISGNKLVLAEASTFGAATCTLAGQQLSSAQVNIIPNVGNIPIFVVTGRRIDITLTGSLVSDDPDVAAMRRTFSQTVFVRSVGGN